ncbi:MAG TPA: PHP domain-containing protein [Actinomycetota bacterium]|nr:PHP domain-containing protein [Actinomycetota bacterium]
MPGIDLHTHSVYSDGTFTPTELLRVARERGLDAIALTDHDTMNGLDEASDAAAELDVELVPGIELSTVYEGQGVHILCYYPDPDDAELRRELDRLRDERSRRGEHMVEKLQALGYPVTFERVRQIAQGGNVVRPHVAQALVEAGIVRTIKDAFTEEFIGAGGKAYVEKDALHPLAAIELIHRAGGVSVLAHPGTSREVSPVSDELIGEFAAAGLDGIEAAHPDHPPELEANYVALAERLGLFWTGSSDCHGAIYEPLRLGMRTTPREQLDALKARKLRR